MSNVRVCVTFRVIVSAMAVLSYVWKKEVIGMSLLQHLQNIPVTNDIKSYQSAEVRIQLLAPIVMLLQHSHPTT